jgi:hypothetical protein
MGKSKSARLPFGERRVANGKTLAPKSLRKRGKQFIEQCTEEELKKAGVQ